MVGGEKALLVSHLSSFSYIDAEDEVRTPFQALSVAEPVEKRTPSFASYKDKSEGQAVLGRPWIHAAGAGTSTLQQ